jgi:hypothetical protein
MLVQHRPLGSHEPGHLVWNNPRSESRISSLTVKERVADSDYASAVLFHISHYTFLVPTLSKTPV